MSMVLIMWHICLYVEELVIVDDQGQSVHGITIQNGNFSIGNISNLTGTLVGKNVFLSVPHKALTITRGLVAGQTGTLDLEITQNSNIITVTITIIIVATL
ncbi:hypothetical protein AAHH17_02330 [Lysinibacillus capsici]